MLVFGNQLAGLEPSDRTACSEMETVRMVQVYLVPGFFGFTQLGSFAYFHRVSEALEHALAKRGITAQIIEIDTIPAGSIRRRATRLLQLITAHGGADADSIHFIGHSTGGLDIRMLLTPSVRLGQSAQEASIADRTRAAIFLSTPHYGTPLSAVLTNLNGRYLLYLLTVLATTLPGRYALYLASRWVTTFARLDHLIGQRENILDNLADNLLSKITPEKGDPTWQFVRRISEDQGAIVQLTPESMEIFNATVTDHPSVEYVSFISAAPQPTLDRSVLKKTNLYQAFTYAVYMLSYWCASREHQHYPYPEAGGELLTSFGQALGRDLDASCSDGIVPALSQAWGRLGGVVLADHLDVVGQFQHVYRGEHYTTWLFSGSGFDEHRFNWLWGEIADVIASTEP